MTANDSFIGAGLRDSPYVEARDRVERMRAALRQYGTHTRHCNAYIMDPETMEREPCSCGLDEELRYG